MEKNIIKVEKVSRIFNIGKHNEVRAIDSVTFSIKKNTINLLKGPSGSGKTTLLSILSCLSKPTSGNYICLNEVVSRWPEKHLTIFRQKHIGAVFQEFNLIGGMTTLYNICLPLIPQNINYNTIEKKAIVLAQTLKIEHRLSYKIDTLSGGEKQRTAIARALINDPEVIFADEPTAHLDSRLAGEIMDIFKILKKMGKTIVIASHDPLLEKSGIMDNILEIHDGKLVD